MHRDAARSPVRNTYCSLSGSAVRRTLAPLALVLAVLFVAAPQVSANIGWCKTDPVLAVGDEVFNIYVSAPEEILQSANGPTDVVVQVPLGTAAEALWTDPGFGFGETVTILEDARLRGRGGGMQLLVSVTVPASTTMPVLVEIVPESTGVAIASAIGATNQTVHIRTAA